MSSTALVRIKFRFDRLSIVFRICCEDFVLQVAFVRCPRKGWLAGQRPL
jgi:hypothetical protein